MKKIVGASLIALLGTNVGAQNQIKLIVGTYTNGSSKGIYSLQFDQQTGQSKPLDTLELSNPSYLTLSTDGSMIYAVSEESDDKASVHAISFDRIDGKMQLINSIPTKGTDPCFVETNDNMVLTANYGGGSLSVFLLNANGSIEGLTQLFNGSTGGPNTKRQNAAHVHCVRYLPDGNGALATDFSADRLLHFDFDGMKSLKPPTVAAKLKSGSGPRHLIFSHDSRFVYVINELSGAITVFHYANRKLIKIQEIQSDEVNAQGSADIHLTPNGKFLYSSNRLKNDGVAIFKVDQQTGMLTKIGYQNTGVHPRNFNITPNGHFLLCASRDNNKIQVFNIDENTGLLVDTNQDILIDRPVCIQFFPVMMKKDSMDQKEPCKMKNENCKEMQKHDTNSTSNQK